MSSNRTLFRARPWALGLTLTALTVLSACQSPPAQQAAQQVTPSTSAEEVGEFRKGSGLVKGYLTSKLYPDSLALLPPPPAAGSAQAQADLQAHRQAQAQRQTLRGKLAAQDAVLSYPSLVKHFSCALALPLGTDATPHLNMLLRRSMLDAGLATYRAKDHYNRQRPFFALGENTCTPAEEAKLSKDGSYPSGHAALGWAAGLILAGLAPERSDALLQRGHAYGQSRMVCGVHWQSDVEAGRLVGSAAVARLQADPVFFAQAQLAAQEIQAARQRNLTPPPADCASEAAGLQP
jgi:acid phosphatase (class A)